MRWTSSVSFLLGLICLCFVQANLMDSKGSESRERKDSDSLAERLRGKWIAESRSVDGESTESDDLFNVSFKVTSEMMKTWSDKTLINNVFYRVNSTLTPV